MTSLWCYLVHPPVNWGSNGQTLTQNITKHVHISLSLSLCVFFLVKHIEGKNARLWCEVFQVQLGYQQGNHVDCHQGKVDYRSHTHTHWRPHLNQEQQPPRTKFRRFGHVTHHVWHQIDGTDGHQRPFLSTANILILRILCKQGSWYSHSWAKHRHIAALAANRWMQLGIIMLDMKSK